MKIIRAWKPLAAAAGGLLLATAAAPAFASPHEPSTLELDYSARDRAEVSAAYDAFGERIWIAATATIDGETYDDAVMRIGSGHPDQESLWEVRLDQYETGQSHDGHASFTVALPAQDDEDGPAPHAATWTGTLPADASTFRPDSDTSSTGTSTSLEV